MAATTEEVEAAFDRCTAILHELDPKAHFLLALSDADGLAVRGAACCTRHTIGLARSVLERVRSEQPFPGGDLPREH